MFLQTNTMVLCEHIYLQIFILGRFTEVIITFESTPLQWVIFSTTAVQNEILYAKYSVCTFIFKVTSEAV